jgi:hypothetical protein
MEEEVAHDNETKTWLVGIPVRLPDSVMRDRDRYLRVVESVRMFVADKKADDQRATDAWELLCASFDEQFPNSATIAAKHGNRAVRNVVAYAVESSVAAQVYMRLTGATLEQVTTAVIDTLAAPVEANELPAAPIGTP